MRKSLYAVLSVMLLVLSSVAYGQIKVGLLVPKSGTYASLGEEIESGFLLALEQEAQTDAFTIVVEDTEIKPPVGLAKARKLVLQDKVDVIVGIVSSGVLAAVRDFVHEAEVPLIVANAGNDHATGASCSPYITRVSFSNGQINRPMGSWLYKKGVKKIYTFAPDYAAGRQMIKAFTESFTASGGEVIGSDFTPFRQTKDYGPYLIKAKSSGADGIYVFYAGGEAISFVKQYASFGLSSSIPLYGSGFVTSPLYVHAQGSAADGIITSLHYVPTLDTPENKQFVKSFQKSFERTPSEYAVQGYDTASVLMSAIDSGGKDRASIAKKLAEVKLVSPRGPVEIDPKTNNIVQNIYIYETIKENGVLTQKVIDTVENVRDPVNGCSL